MSEYKPEQYHWPHMFQEKNKAKTCARLLFGQKIVDKLREGQKVCRVLVVDGKAIDEVKLGTFRRFAYDEYEPEFNKLAKAWVREYEATLPAEEQQGGKDA